MTPTRYFFCRLGLIFGYDRKSVRLSEAGTESHLLKEAEGYLGEFIWEKMENVEPVSVEYWNLRKLQGVHEAKQQELDQLTEEVAEAHQTRAEQLSPQDIHDEDLDEEKAEILQALEELVRDRDEVVAQARNVRRAYEGLKLKQEVLTGDGQTTDPEMLETEQKLEELKNEFGELKQRRGEISERIQELDEQMNLIDDKVAEQKARQMKIAAETFQDIGENNQRLSKLRSELSVLEGEMRQLYIEVGRHASRSFSSDPICKKACKGHRSLVDIMAALRSSILLNHRLAERA